MGSKMKVETEWRYISTSHYSFNSVDRENCLYQETCKHSYHM